MAEWIWWQNFHFLRPWWLLLLLTTVMYLWWIWRGSNFRLDWKHLLSPHLYQALLVRDRASMLLSPKSLVTALSIIVSVALAGPTWERTPSPFAEDKAALVICLDVSSSMNQTDIQPSRLARAQMKIRDLLALRGDSRTGLVVYSGSAHTVIPLTNDRDILENFVSALSTGMMPRPGKFPARALKVADRMLALEPVPGTILFLTDGASASSVPEFAEYFASSRHQLLVLGTGLAADERALAERAAESYLPLQEELLRDLTGETGGRYVELSLDQTDVRRLQRRINYHLQLMQGEEGAVPWEDAGYYLVFLIAALVLTWFRRGWTLQFSLALLVAGSLLTPGTAQASAGWLGLWLTPDQLGYRYFKRGEFREAAKHFKDTQWRATAYYHGEEFEAAADLYLQLDSAKGYFHAANALAHAQRYLQAVDAYDEALRLQPDHAGAANNRELVQSLIDDTNRMSESQQAEPGQRIEELGDEPWRAEGADRETRQQEQKPLSAAEILTSDTINELWMREVQPSPARFLAIKFRMQLDRDLETAADE